MSRNRLLSAPRSFLFSTGNTRQVSGIRVGFRRITGSESVDTDQEVVRHYLMDIVDISERRLMISFHSKTPGACQISDIFFSDGHVFSISVQGVRDTAARKDPSCYLATNRTGGVYAPDPYSDSSRHPMLHGDPEPAGPDNLADGIRGDESLGIVFDLQAGVTLADVVNALRKGRLSISIKVQGEPACNSGIFINDTELHLKPA